MGNENSSDDFDMYLELTDSIAQFWLRKFPPVSVVAWAVRALIEGKGSTNLRILAGLSSDEEGEVVFYLLRTLKDLGIPWPEHHDYLLG